MSLLGEQNESVQNEPAPEPTIIKEEPHDPGDVPEPEPETPAEAPQDPPEPEIELEEVEWDDGKKYTIPKPLKDGVLRHADYTRKTQEVAAQRKALEEHQQAVRAQTEAFEQDRQDWAELYQYDRELKEAETIDWEAWVEQDPVAAQKARFRLDTIAAARNQRAQELLNRYEQRDQETKRERAKRLADAEAVLKRDIKGWGPEIQRSLAETGKSLGFTDEELSAVEDPRFVKVLHRLWTAEQATKAAQSDLPAPVQPAPIQPTRMVQGGRAQVKRPLAQVDDMDEYVRRRQAGEKG